MLKKRLIGVITVRNDWAVQSFGYCRYLPIGKPEVLVENLDRLGADEILVQCIDRSITGLGPNLELLGKISKLSIATPLIYSGGITSREDALKVINYGADRIMVDAMLLDSPHLLEMVARDLGTQAVIAHLPARVAADGLKAFNYKERSELSMERWIERLPLAWISELMVTDWSNEGLANSFDERLLTLTDMLDKPLLCFGGISEVTQIQRIIKHPKVVAVGVGNFLNYREHAVQSLKKQIDTSSLRPPYYEGS